MSDRVAFYSLFCLLFCAGCANITAPTGGRKDTIPPKLVSADPRDSMRNIQVSRLEMHFDEYITVGDVGKEVQLSPILSVPPTVTGRGKTVIVKIVDSLLEPNTTYRLSFGSAIRDLHEGNAFPRYTYTFSTGSYFDSLELHGNVINAFTGLPDTGSVTVELYNGTETDSAVVRHKPRYITKTDAAGNFTFKGLPKREFHIYALKDANNNLVYDGRGAEEWIGFADHLVTSGDTSGAAINLAIFQEAADTAKKTDSLVARREGRRNLKSGGTDAVSYSVNLDTSNTEHRTFDITGFITVTFNKTVVLNRDKITLTYDSLGNTVSPAFTMVLDSTGSKLKINTQWRENMLYKLRLVKGFAHDTGGVEVAPSRYQFRTKQDDDYGKIPLHLPSKYYGTTYLLNVTADGDSIYQAPVTDTFVVLPRLKPAKYSFKIIVDKNHNGKWDTGDLLGHRQPEVVIPYKDVVNVKAGYEYITDFEQQPKPKTRVK